MGMELRLYSYRFADAVLSDRALSDSRDEILQILSDLPVSLLDPESNAGRATRVKHRKRGISRGSKVLKVFALPVNQRAMNMALDASFRAAGWSLQPPVVSAERSGGPETGLKADYKKGRIQVEVQFGNMARWYTDVFKFQLSYSLDNIDVGILVVPTQVLANLIDENVAYYERVLRELPWAKMSLTLPILVVGMQPDSFDAIRECYDRAIEVIGAELEAQGKTLAKVSFDERIQMQPEAGFDDAPNG